MSDYLTHLAARTTGAATTIRPRLNSVYEPPSVSETTPEFETAEANADAAPAQAPEAHRVEVAPAPPRAAQTAQPPAPAVTPPLHIAAPPPPERREREQEREREHTSEPHIERIVERIREVSAAPVEHHTVVERHTETRAVEPAPPAPQPRVQPPAPAPQIIEKITTQQQLVERPVVLPQQTIEHHHLHEHTAARQPDHPATQAIPRFEPSLPAAPAPPPETREPRETAPATPRVAIAPQITRHVVERVRAERAVREEPPPPEPPSIHVTIGRVEVRAVPADAPAARRPAAQAERMSLDDYLKRRAERPAR